MALLPPRRPFWSAAVRWAGLRSDVTDYGSGISLIGLASLLAHLIGHRRISFTLQAGDMSDPFEEAERKEALRRKAAHTKTTVIPPHQGPGAAQPTSAAEATPATGGWNEL